MTTNNINHQEIMQALQELAVPEKVPILARFFKSGKGEYAEGDCFLGVSVPDQRVVAKAYFSGISLNELSHLLSSAFHEHRLTALLMLILKFEKTKDTAGQKTYIDFYLKHLPYINHWDLVDTSCYKILGKYCFVNQEDEILILLSESTEMWHKRIAIVGTMHYVKKDRYDLTLLLVEKNLHHPHDLMHKANGWLLREIGNRNLSVLLNFLATHYRKMPRTSLRYAIEKLPEPLRQDYLKGRI